MIKFIFKLIGCGFFFWIAKTLVGPGLDTPVGIASLLLFFVLPPVMKSMQASASERRWKEEAEANRTNRENAAEYEHQTSMRRERERLEMHAEMRIKELMATLEVTFRADAQKMTLLGHMKAEFAGRQQADMASLLGRLEAMRAGG